MDSMSRLMYWVSRFFFFNLISSLYDVLWFHDQKEFHLRKTLNVSEYESEVYSIYLPSDTMTVLVRTFILEHRSKKWLWSFLLSPFRWLCCPTDRAALVPLNLTSLSQLTSLHATHYPLGGLQKGLLVDLLVLSTVILLNFAAALSPQHRYQLQQGERSPFLPILVGVPLGLISELSTEDLGGSPHQPCHLGERHYPGNALCQSPDLPL